MVRTEAPAWRKPPDNSNSSEPTATAPVVDSTELDAAIVEETGQPAPVPETIAHGLGRIGPAGKSGELMLEEDFERVDERARSCLAGGAPLVSAGAANILFDGIDLPDARHSFGGDRRVALLDDFEELAPQMAPACVRASPGKGDGCELKPF